MSEAFLEDRGIVEVEGEDARALLQRLITNDVEALKAGEARYAALLTPQGKISVDFLVADRSSVAADRFLLDCPRHRAADLALALTRYRLRAKVRIADLSSTFGVLASWPEPPGTSEIVYRDPRHPDLGYRAILARPAVPAEAEGGEAERAYAAHRIACAVPAGGSDFTYGDVFPHDANLDRLNGVDFGKGCYVGQEVVSRVHHRGTARKRIEPVTFLGLPPRVGVDVTVGDIVVGTMGSSQSGRGLAMVRIDRVAEAAALGAPPMADGVHLVIALDLDAKTPAQVVP